jgi:hypothetical protein
LIVIKKLATGLLAVGHAMASVSVERIVKRTALIVTSLVRVAPLVVSSVPINGKGNSVAQPQKKRERREQKKVLITGSSTIRVMFMSLMMRDAGYWSIDWLWQSIWAGHLKRGRLSIT